LAKGVRFCIEESESQIFMILIALVFIGKLAYLLLVKASFDVIFT